MRKLFKTIKIIGKLIVFAAKTFFGKKPIPKIDFSAAPRVHKLTLADIPLQMAFQILDESGNIVGHYIKYRYDALAKTAACFGIKNGKPSFQEQTISESLPKNHCFRYFDTRQSMWIYLA